MCGRFSFATTPDKLRGQFGEQLLLSGHLRSSYNIAPTQHSYVITHDRPDALQYLAWGLVPHWANDSAHAANLVNARMEGIESKPSFRIPIRRKRCIVLADSFYEWRPLGSQRIPYRIRPKDDSLLTMAGIWDTWHHKGYAHHTFAIITTTPNAEMKTLHNRMPALLSSPDSISRWLGDIPLDEVLALLRPAPDGMLDIYRVSEKVNGVQYNAPDLHTAVPEPPTLFPL